MNFIIGQAVGPPLMILFSLFYVCGIPVCAVFAISINLMLRRASRLHTQVLAIIVIAVPLICLVGNEWLLAKSRELDHLTILDEAKEMWPLWAINLGSASLGALALCRLKFGRAAEFQGSKPG